jgi:hypothetical protein
VGYGSECSDCGLISTGEQAGRCGCGVETQAVCQDCEPSGEYYRTTRRPARAPRMAKSRGPIKQVSYTYASGCNDCVESDPCCGDCGEVGCECCVPQCPDPCCECYGGPFAWLHKALNPESYCGGCGELYWGDFHSYPPDCCDPCNRCGQWTGESNCGACRHNYRCGRCSGCYGDPCNDSCGECGGYRHSGMVDSSGVEGPILLSQTDRVARPKELQLKKSRLAKTKQANRTTRR